MKIKHLKRVMDLDYGRLFINGKADYGDDKSIDDLTINQINVQHNGIVKIATKQPKR